MDELDKVVAGHALLVVVHNSVAVERETLFGRVTVLGIACILAEDEELDELEAVVVLVGDESELRIWLQVNAFVVDGHQLRIEAKDALEPLIFGVLKVNDCIDAHCDKSLNRDPQLKALGQSSQCLLSTDVVSVCNLLAFDQEHLEY